MYAMSIPLIPNKVGAWKAWIRECQGTRREEFESFNDRMELTLHRAWLTQNKQGPEVVVVIDGPGAKNFLRNLASSRDSFDIWFRERITEYHGTNFSKINELPTSEMFMDYHVPSYVEVGAK
jgi:hypothetical protein